jgi:hypothetical protein
VAHSCSGLLKVIQETSPQEPLQTLRLSRNTMELSMKNILISALSTAAFCALVAATPASAQETVTGAPRGTAPATIEGYGPSSAIVCNGSGECWHSVQRYDYPQGVQVDVHPFDWLWDEGQHFAWREHDGRGYWQNGEWVTF